MLHCLSHQNAADLSIRVCFQCCGDMHLGVMTTGCTGGVDYILVPVLKICFAMQGLNIVPALISISPVRTVIN